MKALLYICMTLCQLNSDTAILEEDKKGHIFLSSLQSCQDSLPVYVQNPFACILLWLLKKMLFSVNVSAHFLITLALKIFTWLIGVLRKYKQK